MAWFAGFFFGFGITSTIIVMVMRFGPQSVSDQSLIFMGVVAIVGMVGGFGCAILAKLEEMAPAKQAPRPQTTPADRD